MCVNLQARLKNMKKIRLVLYNYKDVVIKTVLYQSRQIQISQRNRIKSLKKDSHKSGNLLCDTKYGILSVGILSVKKKSVEFLSHRGVKLYLHFQVFFLPDPPNNMWKIIYLTNHYVRILQMRRKPHHIKMMRLLQRIHKGPLQVNPKR